MKRWIVSLILGVLLAHNAWANVGDELKALLERGRAGEAYALAKQHPDLIGEPAFDFYFGVAAIDSGHAGEGTLALERYVTNQPGNPYGRLELARAYFVLGEDGRAREEFRRVLEAEPEARVRASVERFLDAIRSRESLYRPTGGFFVEAGFGHDNNVNAGVASGTSFRIFGADVLAPAAFLRRHDMFYTLAAGASGSRPIVPGVFVFGSAVFDARVHQQAQTFDQNNVRLDGGMGVLRGKDLWRAMVGVNQLWLENDRYRRILSASGEWTHQLNELNSVNGFVQWSDLQYEGTNTLRNAGFPILGLSYRRAFISPMQPLLGISAYAGMEDVRSGIRPDLSRDILGVRLSGSLTPAPRWSLTAGLGYQESDYRGVDQARALTFERRDRFTVLDLGLSYAIERNLSLRGEVTVSRNSSNDSLFQYDRNTAGVKLRYDFR